VGTLTSGNLTMAAGSRLQIELQSATAHDVLKVNGP
jgi:hypothetical protein